MNDVYSGDELKKDDLTGLKWLYQYYVSGELEDVQSCTHGYFYDEASNGCIQIGLAKGEHHLIKKVHQVLKVRMLLDSSCYEGGSIQFQTATQLVSDTYKIWLDGLRKTHGLLREDVKEQILNIAWGEDLAINFICRPPASGDIPEGLSYANGDSRSPVINLFHLTEAEKEGYAHQVLHGFSTARFKKFFGAAFGLPMSFIDPYSKVSHQLTESDSLTEGEIKGLELLYMHYFH